VVRNILKEFYYGRIIPIEREVVRDSEVKRAIKELESAESQLRAILQPDTIPLLERYGKAQLELTSITEAEAYIDGFKTGARFVKAILDDSHENLKPIIGA